MPSLRDSSKEASRKSKTRNTKSFFLAQCTENKTEVVTKSGITVNCLLTDTGFTVESDSSQLSDTPK